MGHMYLILSVRDVNILNTYPAVQDCKGQVYNLEDGDINSKECEGRAIPNGGHKSAIEDLPNFH